MSSRAMGQRYGGGDGSGGNLLDNLRKVYGVPEANEKFLNSPTRGTTTSTSTTDTNGVVSPPVSGAIAPTNELPYKPASAFRRAMGSDADERNVDYITKQKEEAQRNADARMLRILHTDEEERARKMNYPREAALHFGVPGSSAEDVSAPLKSMTEPYTTANIAAAGQRGNEATLAGNKAGFENEAFQSARGDILSPTVRSMIIGSENKANEAQATQAALERQKDNEGLTSQLTEQTLREKLAESQAGTKFPVVKGPAFVDPTTGQPVATPTQSIYSQPLQHVTDTERAKTEGKQSPMDAALIQYMTGGGKTNNAVVTPPVSGVQPQAKQPNGKSIPTGPPKVINSQKEYDELPYGALYIDSTGKVKPKMVR